MVREEHSQGKSAMKGMVKRDDEGKNIVRKEHGEGKSMLKGRAWSRKNMVKGRACRKEVQ